MSNSIGTNTRAALLSFSQNIVGGIQSAAYQAIYNAISSSPELSFNLEQDLQIGVLMGFKSISGETGSGVGGQ